MPLMQAKRCILIAFILLIPSSAASHPHVFIDNSVELVFNKEGFCGVRANWVFDEMFSNMIIADCDRNRDGSLNSAEIRAVEKGYFSNLKEYNYFFHIKINGEPFSVTRVSNFTAGIKEQKKIQYRFFVPCPVPATASELKITIAIYDDTYYSDVALYGHTCTPPQHTGQLDLNVNIVRNTDKSFYYGQMHPTEIVVRFKKKA